MVIKWRKTLQTFIFQHVFTTCSSWGSGAILGRAA